jgi:serine/threonine protein phosphatase PrpC
VDLLTIGAFARAAELTPKALRLYDELGLLPPAAVDADSGYRYYDPAQLGRARLVARLRQVGMPLARIQQVCAMPPADAADAVTAYWAEVEAGVAERSRLADSLIGFLSGKGPTMSFTFAARTDVGQVRQTNEDYAYASGDLLAVADGVGGVPGGAQAAEAAVQSLLARENPDLRSLADAAEAAERAVQSLADGENRPATTLTALIRSGSRLGLVHIGDSRAYLLRNGELSRLTQDHTYVQTLVDAGRISSEQARTHAQRPLLVRALGSGAGHSEPDVSLRSTQPGDRYLLCTDGLSAVVPPAAIAGALPGGTPDEAVQRLLDLANTHGAPDNVAIVVADI